MSSILLIILAMSSGYFLKTIPGSMSHALGNVSVIVDEGFSAFHNPAISGRTEVAFSLSRYFNATTMFACGGTYQNKIIGIQYLNYGSIQGYDVSGMETHAFNPYSMSLVLGHRIGPGAVCIKAFSEKIDDYELFGLCANFSMYCTYKGISLGMKVDNLGKIINKNLDIPMIYAIGSRITLPKDLALYVEAKGLPLECSSGIAYTYNTVTLMAGAYYIAPCSHTGQDISVTFDDIHFSGGIIVHVDSYTIGYGFVYTSFTTAHHFTISLIP